MANKTVACNDSFQQRISSLAIRINALAELRTIVTLPQLTDISVSQWKALTATLTARVLDLRGRLSLVSHSLAFDDTISTVRAANHQLGELELDLAKAYEIYDTYLDVLTQRYCPELGIWLAGCDTLAADMLKLKHLALFEMEMPLVHCDRGYGASTLRSEVKFPDGSKNPIPLIQIPYSRLHDKCNLTSILHETGHEISYRLQLHRVAALAVDDALSRINFPDALRDLFRRWCFELIPDYLGFCASGIAATATVREILMLPADDVFNISWFDPHPPPYIRLLIGLEWCEQEWGKGLWLQWRDEWLALYPTSNLDEEHRKIIDACARAAPVVAQVIRTTKFSVLGGKRVSQLFDFEQLHPVRLAQLARQQATKELPWSKPCVQLAIFRMQRELKLLDNDLHAKRMNLWLRSLANKVDFK